MSEGRGRTAAIIAVAAGATLLGLTPIGVKLSELGPQATNFWRFGFALPLLAVMAALGRPNPTPRQTAWLLGAGVLFGFELSLWAAALYLTTVANATLLANMTPLFAAAIGWLLFRERLTGPVLAGGAAALGGAVMLALARAQAGEGPDGGAHGWAGDALGLTAAFGYAGYLLIVRSMRGAVGIGAVMFWATLSGGVYALILSLALGESLLPQTAQGWAILVGLGVVTQVGAQGLIAWGVGRLPIVISTVLLWLQPLSAAALSWLIFEERLTPLALAGAALILGGVFMVQRARR